MWEFQIFQTVTAYKMKTQYFVLAVIYALIILSSDLISLPKKNSLNLKNIKFAGHYENIICQVVKVCKTI